MTARNLKVLATVAAMLVIVFLILDYGSGDRATSEQLFPDLKANINDVRSLSIRSGSDTVTVEKSDDGWTIAERGDYAADIGKLREILLGLADAMIVEQKTSNPDKYHLIGVNDPADEDSEAVQITIDGDGFQYSIILGSTAQTSNRYARIGDDTQSVLINQNPDVPEDAGSWLAAELLNVASARIQQVETAHADGEKIVINKASADTANFEITNIPDARELSYPTVANGIANALSDLDLEDVRVAPEDGLRPTVTTVFRTFDGLQITATEYADGEATWLAFEAAAGETAEDAVQEEAAAINARVNGWQFAIADYKANLFKRRFDDLLKAEAGDD